MGRCEKCSLSEGESKLAREAYLDLMNVPEKYRGTTSDYRGFDAVCCAECGTPLMLRKEVSLLESVRFIRAMEPESEEE